MSEQKSYKPGNEDRFKDVKPEDGLIVDKDRVILDDSLIEDLVPEPEKQDAMTGEELRRDALENGFVLDCSCSDVVLDDSTVDHGFESVEELHRLVANADISTPEKLAAFNHWQDQDGTKEGLLKLQQPVVPATEEKPGTPRERWNAKFTTHKSDLIIERDGITLDESPSDDPLANP